MRAATRGNYGGTTAQDSAASGTPEVASQTASDTSAAAPVRSSTTEEAGVANTAEINGRGTFLHWAGRKSYRALVPAPRVLEPDSQHSDVTENDPGNFVIEGDNLQAMVSLRGQLARQVNVVLIDPPYNTGKSDFRFSDRRFKDPDADDSRGDFIRAEHGGRHTMWLNMMAPRLVVIRDLMADDGVIFVHIDDRELPRLLLLMEEVFDESNRIGTLVWKSASDNNPSQIVVEHEYIVCYAKDRSKVSSSWRGQMDQQRQMLTDAWATVTTETDIPAERRARWAAFLKENKGVLGSFANNYRHIDDERGPFMTADLSFPGGGGPRYDVIHPVTGRPTRVPPHGYRVTQDAMNKLLEEGKVHFGRDERNSVLRKLFLSEVTDDPLRSVIARFGGKGVNADVKRLFPDQPDAFPNPKPVALEEYLLSFVTTKDAIVLDAFAGSGTTGHAIMTLNSKDAGTRRFILIEEGNAGDAYATTLTAERLRRARQQEHLPGGFTFYRVGAQIDREAFAALQRESIVAAVRQSDASGRGSGIRAIEGDYVIGANRRGQPIALVWRDGSGHVTLGDVRAIFEEAKALDLTWPVRVYGTSCEVEETDDFRFFRLPDEVIANLTVGVSSPE